MTTLETQAADLSAQIAGIDRSMEELRVERLRVYRRWVETVQGIADARNLEQKAMQAQHAPCEGLQHFGHHDDPMQWEDQHAQN